MPSPLQSVISAQIGPRDGVILKLHSDAIAVIRQLLTINHFPTGRIFIQWSKAHQVAKWPGVLREYASAMCTDVIGERLLLSIGTRAIWLCEAQYDDDLQPPFHSATGPVVQSVLCLGMKTFIQVFGRGHSKFGAAVVLLRGQVPGHLIRCLEPRQPPHVSMR